MTQKCKMALFGFLASYPTFITFYDEGAKMTEATIEKTAEVAAKEARILELKSLLQQGIAEKGVDFLDSAESQAIADEIMKLKGKTAKVKSVTDPRLLEEKKALTEFLFGTEGDEASGQSAKVAEKLNAHLQKNFKLLAESGAKIEVLLKIKGAGKSAASVTGTAGSVKYARILHRTETGERCRSGKHPAGIDPQGLASKGKLIEAYPEAAVEIEEVFGTGAKRNILWNESKNAEGVGNTNKVYITLKDNTTLCLQS